MAIPGFGLSVNQQLMNAARYRFHEAAYTPSRRPQLILDLQSDPVLYRCATEELVRLEEVIRIRGEGADHVSATTRNCLRDVLAQVQDAPGQTVTIKQETP